MAGLACGLLTLACASSSTTANARRADCDVRPEDSVFVATGPAFRDCGVDQRATLTTKEVRPDYQASGPDGCSSADLEYVVSTDGGVELGSARVVRASDDAFAQAALLMLPKLRFQPATRDGVPVRMIVREKVRPRPSLPAGRTVETKC